ncbi:MAG: hypothetical protein JWO28_1761 [Hyphomicrobiales bacterium]|jgi:hypothetical protein|nr:hypothetical protein [Hyphomicrobiales bacterium]
MALRSDRINANYADHASVLGHSAFERSNADRYTMILLMMMTTFNIASAFLQA